MGRHSPADEVMVRFLAALLSGVAGALGIGGGGILIIYLAAICNMEQLQAQGINLLFFIPCGIIAVALHSLAGRIKWKKALTYLVGGIPGALIGVWCASFIGTGWLGKIFAVLLLYLGVKSIFAKEKA